MKVTPNLCFIIYLGVTFMRSPTLPVLTTRISMYVPQEFPLCYLYPDVDIAPNMNRGPSIRLYKFSIFTLL
jgi:hypothetical protein